MFCYSNVVNNEYRSSSDSKDGAPSPWDSLAEFANNDPDALDDYSVSRHGVSLDEEESELLVINNGDGEPIPIVGRAFSGDKVISMPVERSDGTVDHSGWVFLGMKERIVKTHYDKGEEAVMYYVAVKIGDGGARMMKMIRADKQEALMSRLSADNQEEQSRLPVDGESGFEPSADDHASYETPEQRRHRERIERIFKFPEPQGRDRFGNSLDTRLEITPESEEAAAWAFRFTGDQKIKEMIRDYAGDKWREEEMPSVVRGNDDLRTELGLYLLSKFDDFETELHMPERVANNSTKNTSHRGYERGLTSREYAALLAVSMLDGTFDPGRATHDPIELEDGQAIRGQHRYAAALLLKLINLNKLNLKRLN